MFHSHSVADGCATLTAHLSGHSPLCSRLSATCEQHGRQHIDRDVLQCTKSAMKELTTVNISQQHIAKASATYDFLTPSLRISWHWLRFGHRCDDQNNSWAKCYKCIFAWTLPPKPWQAEHTAQRPWRQTRQQSMLYKNWPQMPHNVHLFSEKGNRAKTIKSKKREDREQK